MDNEKIHSKFEEAIEFVNEYSQPIPADLLLKLYAFYKIAKKNYNNPGSKTPLINAFKANALIQAKNISRKEAREKYIELVDSQLRTN